MMEAQVVMEEGSHDTYKHLAFFFDIMLGF